jgi:hypothetical protein
MAQQDLAGMLTGITQAPIDPMVTSGNQAQRVARAQQYGTQMRQGIGSLFGADTRTTKEKADQMLASLDVNDVNDQEKILQIVSNVNPQAAPLLKAQFAQQARVKEEETTALTKQAGQRESFANYLDKTYSGKGYGNLARQGLITPANMKNFIKEADGAKKTTTETISENGVNKLVVLDSDGDIVKRYDAEISGTSNPNAPTYFRDKVIRDGKEVNIMFKREGDRVTEVATLGTTSLPETDADLEKIEVTKDDGQTYVQFLDLSKPKNERVVHEQKINENRVITEAVDPLTGQKVKYSTLPDGKGRIQFGVTELPKYKVEEQDDGTYNVVNETLGILEQEGVPTKASADLLIAKKQKTQETLTEIDRQIGFINEAKTITESYQPTDAVIFHPLMKYVPYSDAKYLENLTETLKSRIGRDALMELREGSAVGSTGLGALNLKELEMLQNALGMLDPTVGDERFRKQLDIVKKHYQGFRATLMGRPSEVDWSNPAYREFTKTVTGADGKPQTYYTLSDATGAPLSGSDGKPMWYRADFYDSGDN